MTADNAMPSTQTVVLRCAKCGASLPDEADFCLKCGNPVSLPSKSAPVVEVLPPATPLQRKKRRVFLWLLLVLFAVMMLWIATSNNPFAQGLQEMVGFKQDEVILDAPFVVGPHLFRYYKFSLPEGSVNVTVVGQFTCTADTSGNVRKEASKDKASDTQKDKTDDSGIEVYVLTESAFTVWQNGYATSAVYESGKVPEGTMQAEIPAGAGIYYLVFNNKFSPKTPKSVRASVALRYKSWMPDWIRRMKARVWNWVGLI